MLNGNNVSLETLMSLILLQLPSLCLALYGIFCAFKQERMKDRIINSALSLILIFVPYILIELFTLLEWALEVGPIWLDLLKFLPQKDSAWRDRQLSVAVCKLVCGSCLQLCFQVVLYNIFFFYVFNFRLFCLVPTQMSIKSPRAYQ